KRGNTEEKVDVQMDEKNTMTQSDISSEWEKLRMLYRDPHTTNQKEVYGFVELCTRMCENITYDPLNKKFHAVNYERIQSRIEKVPNGLKILQLVGFELQKQKGSILKFNIVTQTSNMKYLLNKCIYKDFPELKPMEDFQNEISRSEITESNSASQIKDTDQATSLRHRATASSAKAETTSKKESSVVKPTFGTKCCRQFHQLQETLVLLIIFGLVIYFLFKVTIGRFLL
ncbi:hypothetical protein RFI_23551, partial [Reticulomyxa filosa]